MRANLKEVKLPQWHWSQKCNATVVLVGFGWLPGRVATSVFLIMAVAQLHSSLKLLPRSDYFRVRMQSVRTQWGLIEPV